MLPGPLPGAVQAQSQEVTPTADATGANPPAQPTNLQATAEHDAVALTWTASTDQTVTHHAVLRRNRDTDPSQVFHVIKSNAGAGTSYEDTTVAAESKYNYRVKSVSPTGISQWSGYVKAETPAAPDSTLEPTPTPTPTPTPAPELVSTPAPVDLRPTGLTVSLVENKVTLSWTAPLEDADSPFLTRAGQPAQHPWDKLASALGRLGRDRGRGLSELRIIAGSVFIT